VSDVGTAVEALRAGKSVILPTDTVYGLACSAAEPTAVSRMYALKGRGEATPTALLAASVDDVLAAVPELRGAVEDLLREFLPGGVTFVVNNPARRFPWLGGKSPATIGIRIPVLSGDARAVVAQAGPVAATSANHPGGSDPRGLDDVPDDLRARVGAVVDGGVLPGVPSTVVDLTGPEPVVLRDGATDASLVLERLAARAHGAGSDPTDS
jgi:L-threonylcarbamoyladenylate synthase